VTGPRGSNKEIEEEKEDAEEKKSGAPGKAPLRKFSDRLQDGGRNNAKARQATRFIERA
jgi:hypothetical protein